MKQCVQARLHRVPATWNQRVSRESDGTSGKAWTVTAKRILRSQKGKGPVAGPFVVFEAEAQRLRSMSLTNSLRGRAPRARSATSPFLKRMKVGIEVIW